MQRKLALPALAIQAASKQLSFRTPDFERVTHYLLRYPAKFHPPVARHLVENFTQPGAVVLDPFCGSGTLLVEASLLGRHAFGVDIDPLAVLASSVKARRLQPGPFATAIKALRKRLSPHRRDEAEYVKRQHVDLSAGAYEKELAFHRVRVPNIPNVLHWFRRYVLVDLALIKRAIERDTDMAEAHRQAFRLCFASIIRAASNADPVPVSGLEVTSHMKEIDEKGRVVDPFTLFEKALTKFEDAFEAYWPLAQPGCNGRAIHGDARILGNAKGCVDAVITSPPYHGAVDYYRRHTLETYWLGFAHSLEERQELLPSYIGRTKVSQKHEYVTTAMLATPYAMGWEKRIRKTDEIRADAFKHYAVSMNATLGQVARVLRPGGLAIFVVGNSRCGDLQIDTSRMLAEFGAQSFDVTERFWYRLKNRYMSYSRHNGASIDREHVIILKKRD